MIIHGLSFLMTFCMIIYQPQTNMVDYGWRAWLIMVEEHGLPWFDHEITMINHEQLSTTNETDG